MRNLVVAGLLSLAGCGPITAEQSIQYNAERDHAWCVDIGIDRDDPRYAQCRFVARQLRLDAASVNTARAAALLGAGADALPRNDRLIIDVQ